MSLKRKIEKRNSKFLISLIIFGFALIFFMSAASAASSTVYVDGSSGNNSWDGQYAIHSGNHGPKATIQSGISTVSSNGTVNVASGTYKENLNITKSVKLAGTNFINTIIDGNGKGSVITVNPGVTVSITNFKLQNGKAKNDGSQPSTLTAGGGIYNRGTLTLTNCLIQNNNANYGGGIYNEGNFIVYNSTIISNTASDVNDNYDPRGGGICNFGNITLFNSNVASNTAESLAGSGGAIYNGANGYCILINSTVKNNGAHFGGGISNGGFTEVLKYSRITGNDADQTGGIRNSGYLWTDNTQYVSGNTPTNIDNVGSGKTQIWTVMNQRTQQVYLSIQDALNSAISGDTILLGSATFYENIKINTNITLLGTGNSTINGGGNGRCIFINPNYVVTLNGLIITNGKGRNGWDDGNSCLPGDSGGAIYNQGTLTIINTTISNNKAGNGGDADGRGTGGVGGYGGAIYNSGTLTIKNSTLSNNTAGNGGAGASNTAGEYDGGVGGSGGAIYSTGNLTITNTLLINNQAGNGGGGASCRSGGAGGAAGAIYSNGNLTVNNATFSNNKAGKSGDSHKKYIHKDSSDSDGAASSPGGAGGAIYSSGNLTINRSTFSDNTAGNGAKGGDGTFDDDGGAGGAGGNGGSIYNAGSLIITTSTFTNNTAGNGGNGGISKPGGDGGYSGYGGNGGPGGSGGAIYSTKNFTLLDVEFMENKAGNAGNGGLAGHSGHGGIGGSGGAIFLTSTNGTFNVPNCIFTNNTAGKGGNGGNGGTWDDHSGNGNAGGSGGAILISGTDTAYISNSKFTDNAAAYGGNGGDSKYGGKGGAGGAGGAIQTLDNINLNVLNSKFTNNTAICGGAISHQGKGNLDLINNTFTKNNAIVVLQGKTKDCLVIDNSPSIWQIVKASVYSAAALGAVYTANIGAFVTASAAAEKEIAGIIDVIHKTHTDYGADADKKIQSMGGAVYIDTSGVSNVINCNFSDGNASVGGAIQNYGNTTLNITESTFHNNTAGYGGAIYSDNLGSLNIYRSIFSENHGGAGGAILYGGTTNKDRPWANLTVTSCVFLGNIAPVGGIIYLGINGTSHSNVNYNMLYGVRNYDIFNVYSSNKIDAKYNWWGSNNGPGTYDTNTWNVEATPYMILTVTSNPKQPAEPKLIEYGQTATIIADMLHDSTYDPSNPDRSYHDPSEEVLPFDLYRLNVTFTRDNGGNIDPVTVLLVNGRAYTNYTANGTVDTGDMVKVYARTEGVSNNSVSTTVKVAKIPTETAIAINGDTITVKVRYKNINKFVPGGDVKLRVGLQDWVTLPLVNGTATYSNGPLPKGTYTIEARYDGTDIYGSSSVMMQIVQNSNLLGGSKSQPQLYLTLTPSNDDPVPGEMVYYVIKLGNAGPGVAHDVVGSQIIPEGYEFVNATVDSGYYTYDPVTRNLTWYAGDVPVGDPYMYLNLLYVGSSDNQTGLDLSDLLFNLTSSDYTSSNANNSGNSSQGAIVNATTVPMQKTGAPINLVVLAILGVLGGLIVPKIRK